MLKRLVHYPLLAALAGLSMVAAPAHAQLQPRLGGKAYYDPQLDVTFIANANLPLSRPLGIASISPTGQMPWLTAKSWVQRLDEAGYLGFHDWRLPTVSPINGSSFQFGNPDDPYAGYDGTGDLGYNISAPGTAYAGSTASELPYLYYNDLKSIAGYDVTGQPQNNAGNTNRPLRQVQLSQYWTSERYGSDGVYAFNFADGSQYAYVAIPTRANQGNVWWFNVIVVRSGDVGEDASAPAEQ